MYPTRGLTLVEDEDDEDDEDDENDEDEDGMSTTPEPGRVEPLTALTPSPERWIIISPPPLCD